MISLDFMRKAMIAFLGTFHHAMSRGHEGKSIFKDIKIKIFFDYPLFPSPFRSSFCIDVLFHV